MNNCLYLPNNFPFLFHMHSFIFVHFSRYHCIIVLLLYWRNTMYFTTKTNTGVYLFLCARWTHYQADTNRNLRWSASKPRPNRVILVHTTPQWLFSFVSCKPKTFPSHSTRVGTRPCCLFICLSKQTKQNSRYYNTQTEIRGVVARNIVVSFPNIQTKQKIYKKKNNRQTKTKEKRALLFVCLLFLFQLFNQTSKQNKNKK